MVFELLIHSIRKMWSQILNRIEGGSRKGSVIILIESFYLIYIIQIYYFSRTELDVNYAFLKFSHCVSDISFFGEFIIKCGVLPQLKHAIFSC